MKIKINVLKKGLPPIKIWAKRAVFDGIIRKEVKALYLYMLEFGKKNYLYGK